MQVTDKMIDAANSELKKAGYIIHHLPVVRRTIKSAIQAAWISIDDELPVRGSQVLILSNELPIIGYRNSDDTLRVFGTHKLIINATHWMPLPEHKM